MRQILSFATIAFTLLFTIQGFTATPANHLNQAKEKYPYSLLGEDFGVLNEDDLAANTCNFVPTPFSTDSTGVPYWRCFETKTTSLQCDSNRTPDHNEGIQGLIVLAVRPPNAHDEYIARRPMSIRSCHLFQKEFQRLTYDTKYICISGAHSRTHVDKNDKKVSIWVLDKYKTKRGCDSYFEGDCDLSYQLKHGCKLSPMQPTS